MNRMCVIEGCDQEARPGSKTCSKLHSDMWRKLTTGARVDGPQRVCRWCGKTFVPHGPQTECCADHHRLAVSDRRASRRQERA